LLALDGFSTDRSIPYWVAGAGYIMIALTLLFGFWHVGRRFPLAYHTTASSVHAAQNTTGPSARLQARTPIYFFLVVSTLAFCIQPLARIKQSSVVNGSCEPAVVAPGQEVRIYVDNSLDALDGHWGGDALITLLNEQDFKQLPELTISTREHRPADIITTENRLKRPSIYAEVGIPDRAELAGATLMLAIQIDVVYPQRTGPNKFLYQRTSISHRHSVRVATPSQATADRMLGYAYAIGLCSAAIGIAWALWRNERIRKSPPEVLIEQVVAVA